MKKDDMQKGEIVIYETSKHEVKLEVRLEKGTVWLTQSQIALFFGTQRPAITKHLNNIFRYGELNKNSVGSILEHTAADGKTYKTHFYNLDAIISVGYRVKLGKGLEQEQLLHILQQLSIWKTNVQKMHIAQRQCFNGAGLAGCRKRSER
jgi:hypothetical protein